MSALAGGEQYSAKDSKTVVPVAPPPCDWTGFYIGSSLGWRGGDSRWYDDTPFFRNRRGTRISQNFESGFTIGLQAGYNRQLTSWFVLGAEVTGSWSTNPDGEQIYSNGQVPGSFPLEVIHFRTENDFTGTLAAKAGISLLNNKFLLYAKGGGAVTHWNYTFIDDLSAIFGFFAQARYEQEDTRFSPMVGAGAEYAFNCHWSARVEWNHIFLGRENNPGTVIFQNVQGQPPVNVNFSQEVNYDSVQVGLNYKF
ncbi:MAG: outer membrane beta-barrel protein [Verrucomicrobiota bacterium]|nr:outer membrane beta-barrel protein [Verrucomicrobiota bacterium]